MRAAATAAHRRRNHSLPAPPPLSPATASRACVPRQPRVV
jgi:hypothetical protein